MKVAITVWQDRISPVFDSSQWLQVHDINGDHVDVHREHIGGRSPFEKVERLKELGVDILLCGAVTRALHISLISAGMDVYPFVCGSADAVLKDLLKNRKIDRRFAMPGYGRQIRKRSRRGLAGHGIA